MYSFLKGVKIPFKEKIIAKAVDDQFSLIITLTAPDRCFYLNQAYLSMFIAGLKRGKTNRSQTATDVAMVIK